MLVVTYEPSSLYFNLHPEVEGSCTLSNENHYSGILWPRLLLEIFLVKVSYGLLQSQGGKPAVLPVEIFTFRLLISTEDTENAGLKGTDDQNKAPHKL